MWAANKHCIILLILGLMTSVGLYYYTQDQGEKVANQALLGGICVTLFVCASLSFWLARRNMPR